MPLTRCSNSRCKNEFECDNRFEYNYCDSCWDKAVSQIKQAVKEAALKAGRDPASFEVEAQK